MATRVAGGSADRNLGRTWNALRPVAEWSARRWNRQPAGFAIGGVAPVGQAFVLFRAQNSAHCSNFLRTIAHQR
jgi:hypothetical protein